MLVLVYQDLVYLLPPFFEFALGALYHPSNHIVLLLLAVTIIVHFPSFLYQGSFLFPFILHPSLPP